MRFAQTALALSALVAAALPAAAQSTVKVGLIAPMTGPQAASGRQMVAGAKLYMSLKGNKVGNRTIELVVRDDTGVADVTRRVAQEMIVNDKVSVLSGFGLTPLAMAIGPVITQSKVPAVIMVAGTASIVGTSPYFSRASFTLPQNTMPVAEWAAKNGIKNVVSLVSDYGPGLDAQNAFKAKFEASGGKVVEQLKMPLESPEFAPYLQRAKDLKPDAVFLFVPAPQAGALMKQVVDRGLTQAGIKVIGTGDVTDDDQLNAMGDGVLGMITSYNYSAAHESPENTAFVEAFKKANDKMRPNVIGLSGYDGMHLIYEAIRKADSTDGSKLIDAMKGMSWTSPRGPMSIDPQTRDVTQNVYIRRVERKNGELYNIEFSTFGNQKGS
jgi:branched-chain amino acid transport system substrate-binding protein